MNDTPSGFAPIFPKNTTHPAPPSAQWWLDIVHSHRLGLVLTAVAKSLAAHANPSGKSSSPGRKKVCQDTGLEPAEVSRAFRTLRDLELLDVDGECDPHTGHTRYLLVSPPKGLSKLERDLLLKPAEELARECIGTTLDDIPGTVPTHDETVIPLLPSPASRSPKPTSKRKGIRRQETVLYHYYDDSDVLLYVGITSNMFARTSSHEADSTWMDFAVRSTIEHFPDRDDALEAERATIEEKRPLFNVEHNDYPDRVARLVDYLIDRDRRDLLVPLISRG